MAYADAKYGIVNLDNVRQNNIVHIDLGKPLSESIFEQQYKMAARIIAGIIRESESALEKWKGYCSECRHNDCDVCTHRVDWLQRGENGPKQNLTSFHTAVPFIGDRGTGKTSVMYSVWERLRNYNGTNPNAAFHLGSDFNNVKFVAFDMIDAGMLKTTDDVMEIILAQMLEYLEEFRTDNDFRELYRQIDELHEDLCLVHGDKQGKREEYGLTGLQRIADSRAAVYKFQKLVKEFIQTMTVHKFNRQPCYLVIALDDIDMYQGSNWGMKNTQFALLEHIYCHLRIPGLIVLMTYNEHLLKRACNRHFEDIYFGCQVSRPYTATEQQDIAGLTAQFMSKLFPQEKRIYMPNYLLVDALDQPNLYVCPKLNGKQLDPFETGENKLPVKEFMLRLIAHKTGVYFDATGTKKHFFEPRNLRELGELFQIVFSMDAIPKKPEKQETVRTRNRQALLEYLKNQFALRNLNAEEYEQFTSLMMLPLWRQDRTLIDKIRQQRQVVAKASSDFGYLYSSRDDRWRYSYGELLHNIYFSTRISKSPENQDPYLRKEFMHCIFGTHSIQMNEVVRSAKSRQDMMKVIGSSIAGRWANSMLPKLWLQGYGEKVSVGSISLPIRDFFAWQISKEVQDAVLKLCIEGDHVVERIIYQFLEALVVAGMFFTNVPAKGLGIRLDVDTDEEGKSALYLCSDSEGHVCYNVLNFTINLYNALPDENTQQGGYLQFIQEKLRKLGADFAESLSFDWKHEIEDVKDALDNLRSEEERERLLFNHPKMMSLRAREIKAAERKIEHANLWVRLQNKCLGAFTVTRFLECWNSVLNRVVSQYYRSISDWQDKYEPHQWVLPVQNFDMMYNINKRLANVSYHDIPDDANVSEVFAYYIRLYDSIAMELQRQDEVYFRNQSGRFAEALRDSVFYRVLTANARDENGNMNEGYNPFIEDVLISMISSTISAQAARIQASDIPL